MSVKPVISENPSESKTARSARTWNLSRAKQIYTDTKKYCEDHGKLIDQLTLADYEVIGASVERAPELCMSKVREMLISGTTRAGVWSKAEDELLM